MKGIGNNYIFSEIHYGTSAQLATSYNWDQWLKAYCKFPSCATWVWTLHLTAGEKEKHKQAGEQAGVRLTGIWLETTVHGSRDAEYYWNCQKKAWRVSTQAVGLKAQRNENGLSHNDNRH